MRDYWLVAVVAEVSVRVACWLVDLASDLRVDLRVVGAIRR